MRRFLGMRALVALLIAFLTAGHIAAAADLVVEADTLYLGNGQSYSPGVVVIRDGLVEAAGAAGEVTLPEGVERVQAAVATPGLIDVRNVVGLAGAKNQPHDQDQLERSAAIQPELRAIDAYNPREQLVDWLREHGITTMHTGHGPGEIISGQTMIVKTTGRTVDESVLEPSFALAASLGDAALHGHGRSSPGSRSKAVAMLRAALIGAREAMERDNGARDLGQEALIGVLNGEMPLLLEVHRHHDIITALRLAEEFDLRLMLSGATEAYKVVDEILAAGVPVMLHPTMQRARGAGRDHTSFTTASVLMQAGVPVAIQGGFESYVPKARVVLFEAAMTLPYGASFEQALASITRHPAEILGIDDRVGTLEPGKHGDVALFDGDPFEYTTQVTGTVIEGRVVSRQPR